MSYDAETKSNISSAASNTSSSRRQVQFHDGIKGFYSRVHKIIGLKTREKQEQSRIEISAPFNFQKGNIDLAGISSDELSMLKEQCLATRIGIVDPEDDDEDLDTFTSTRRRPAGLARSSSGPILDTIGRTPMRRPLVPGARQSI